MQKLKNAASQRALKKGAKKANDLEPVPELSPYSQPYPVEQSPAVYPAGPIYPPVEQAPVYPIAQPQILSLPSAPVMPAAPPPILSAPYVAPTPFVVPSAPVVQPTADYWGPAWQENKPGYQWEVQNLRRELEWAYHQLQTVDADRGQAAEALNRLREAERRWYESDMKAQAELRSAHAENHHLRSKTDEAWNRMRGAEENWHRALQNLERQKFETNQAKNYVGTIEADAARSKSGLLEQLDWAHHQLGRAQEEIMRLRPCEAHFDAVTSEVEYLRAQMNQMRQLEDRFVSVCKETEMLRAQVVKQEHNIDRYTHQTESFYNSANQENATVKTLLEEKQDELRALHERYQDAIDEIHQSHDQVRRAEQEINKLRRTADGLHEFVSEAIYLKHQHGDAAKQIEHLQNKIEQYARDNDALLRQVDVQEKEMQRLTLALSDETQQHRFLNAALNEEIADNKAVRRQLNEEVVHQQFIAVSAKNDAASLSNEAAVREREIERQQKRLAETTAELDKYTNMYQEALSDVDRLKAALTEEIAEHKYARGLAEQQKKKADMAVEELERVGCDRSNSKLSKQLAECEAENIHLKNRLAENKAELERLKSTPKVREIVHEPHTVGYRRGEPVVHTGVTTPHRYAYFGVEVAEGVYLTSNYGEGRAIPAVRVVNVGGPCAKAGLKPGDLISSINGRQVGSLDDFNAIVSSVEPNTEVKIIFERNERLLGTDVVTQETKREPGMPGNLPEDSFRNKSRTSASDKRGSPGSAAGGKPMWKK